MVISILKLSGLLIVMLNTPLEGFGNNSTVNMSNTVIQSNIVTTDGAGVSILDSTVINITDSRIASNNAINSKRNNNNNNNEEDDNDDRKTLKWFIQHILLPSCRSRYYPRREFATDGTILQIAALEDLYRQFER